MKLYNSELILKTYSIEESFNLEKVISIPEIGEQKIIIEIEVNGEIEINPMDEIENSYLKLNIISVYFFDEHYKNEIFSKNIEKIENNILEELEDLLEIRNDELEFNEYELIDNIDLSKLV